MTTEWKWTGYKFPKETSYSSAQKQADALTFDNVRYEFHVGEQSMKLFTRVTPTKYNF